MPVMATQLAPKAIRPNDPEELRPEQPSPGEDPSGEETMRLIAALWDWALARELEGSSAA